MLAVVSLHRSLESSQCAVDFHVHRYVDFSRSSPDYNDACAAVLLLEVADVLAQRLNHLPAGLAVLHVVAVQTLGVVLVECSLHRNNLLQLLAHRVDVLLLQNLGIHGSLIGILRIDIPGAEYDVVEVGKRNDVLVVQILLVCALAHANLVVLGH